MHTNADVELKEMKKTLTQLTGIGRMTGKTILDGHFNNLLKSSIADRFLRSSFTNSSGKYSDVLSNITNFVSKSSFIFNSVTKNPKNYYKFVSVSIQINVLFFNSYLFFK